MTKKTLYLLSFLFIVIIAGVAYWYFFLRATDTTMPPSDDTTAQGGFTPIDRGGPRPVSPAATSTPISTATSTSSGTEMRIPALRLLSSTPVSGYGASTTGTAKTPVASSTTVVRWLDRGRGNVYETQGNSLTIKTVSNTVVPKMYETLWDKNLTSFMAFGISADNTVSGIWSELRARIAPKVSSTTSAAEVASFTPYELRGKSLPDNILAYAVSPRRDRAFIMIEDSGSGVGYIFKFDGSSPTQLFVSPLTQVTAEWPEEQTITITTKAAADARGYLYFVNTKTGVWKKILGPLPGLTTKVSTDAKKVFVSVAGNADNILSSIYDVTRGTGTDALVRTIADKCVWGNTYKDLVYCAVPAQPTAGTYPDDWHRGDISFVDKLWQINASTGEVHVISTIIDASDRVIDAFNLGLDARDDFLFFMNKNDLSLWSYDLK